MKGECVTPLRVHVRVKGKTNTFKRNPRGSKAKCLLLPISNPENFFQMLETRPRMSGRKGFGAEVGFYPSTAHPLPLTRLLGGHSEVDPRLPIPNRTVKRLCADASADCPRESMSPPGAQ